jgi:hypothetical protein
MGKRKFKKTKFPVQPKIEEKVLEVNYLEICKKTLKRLKERIKKHGKS